MNTMSGTIPMDAVLAMLNSLSHHDRRWLVEQLSAQVEREEAEAQEDWQKFLETKTTPTWEEEDNEKLDAALAHFDGDWGGEGTPMEIARELRQGAEMVREINAW